MKVGSVRVRITIEAEEIDLDVRGIAVNEFAVAGQRETWSIGILIRIEEDVGAVILVITFKMGTSAIGRSIYAGATYSRAQR